MDEENTGGSGSTLIYDLVMLAAVATVCLIGALAHSDALISVGIFASWGAGLIVMTWALFKGLMAVLSRKKDLTDFSSLPSSVEQMFVPHEQTMQANASRAAMAGFGIAGALFVIGLLVTMGMYSPCTKFCGERAPITCKTDQQVAAWKASCDSTCARYESSDGKDAVQRLAECSFAGGAGESCAGPVQKATTLGLWCPEK